MSHLVVYLKAFRPSANSRESRDVDLEITQFVPYMLISRLWTLQWGMSSFFSFSFTLPFIPRSSTVPPA